MGYGAEMRDALDTTRPVLRRYSALRQAVSGYCPLGYTATWGYITAEARPNGDFRYDAEAITRAAAIVQASRAIWLNEMREFAEQQKVEKRDRQRQVLKGALSPTERQDLLQTLDNLLVNRFAELLRYAAQER